MSQYIGLATLTIFLSACGSDKEAEGKKEGAKVENTSTDELEVHAAEDCPAKEGCFICDKSKRDAGRLWCKEHDRYEDRCFLCHPDIKDPKRLYCTEHGVYEDECYLCHPELKNKETKSSSPSKSSGGLICKEHDVLERECAICHPELASGLKAGGNLKIRVASADSMHKVGVEVSKPEMIDVKPVVEAYATVDYNQNKVAKITPIIEGIVQRIDVVPGQNVGSGEILGMIHSPGLAEMKSSYLAALAKKKLSVLQVNRERKLADKQISAKADLETAEATAEIANVNVAVARQRLINTGLSESEINLLASDGRPTSLLSLKAPFAGVIVKRNVTTGERIEPGEEIFILADLSTMWLELSIPAKNAAGLTQGMKVSATFTDLPDTIVNGELVWIDSAVDGKTRRLKARALITQPPSSLKKGMYGEARIQIRMSNPSLAVPVGAVQNIDGVSFVFVRKEPELYAATRVEIADGTTSKQLTAISKGLSSDDLIVTQGSYILRSEFLKSLLGAGCVDD